MLRKLSTRFRSRKEEASGANGINGVNGTTHGVTNGTNGESRGKPNLKERHSSFAPFKSKKDTSDHSTDHSASRRDVENSFEQFAQLIHASVRIHAHLLFSKALQPRPKAFPESGMALLVSIYYHEGEKLIPELYAAGTFAHTGW